MAKPRRKPVAKRRPGGASAAAARSGARPAAGAASRTSGAARPARGSAPVTAESPLRTAVAERSRGPVLWLSRLPGFVIPVLMVALLLVGLLAPLAVAVVALAVIVAFIGWLAFLSWPVLASPQRAMRVLAIGIVVVAVVGRVAGWL